MFMMGSELLCLQWDFALAIIGSDKLTITAV